MALWSMTCACSAAVTPSYNIEPLVCELQSIHRHKNQWRHKQATCVLMLYNTAGMRKMFDLFRMMLLLFTFIKKATSLELSRISHFPIAARLPTEGSDAARSLQTESSIFGEIGMQAGSGSVACRTGWSAARCVACLLAAGERDLHGGSATLAHQSP